MLRDRADDALQVEAAFELDMIIKDTEKLVAKKEAAFAKVAHVWSCTSSSCSMSLSRSSSTRREGVRS